MQIYYVGNNEIGSYAISEVCKQANGNISLSTLMITEDDHLNSLAEILIDAAKEVYVFDITSFDSNEEDLVRFVINVKQSTNAKVIVFAPGYLDDSRILTSFRGAGVTNIITTSRNLGNIQRQFHGYITRNEETTPDLQDQIINNREAIFEELLKENESLTIIDKYLEPAAEETKEPEVKAEENIVSYIKKTKINKKMEGTIRIAVVGSKRSIGTTTAAIQFVKYLNGIEPGTAAYLEYNQTGYVENFRNTYILDSEDTERECVTFKSVEMYMNPRKLSLLPIYDYLIYDYGSIEDIMDLSSVYEKDLIILVGGAKPNANEMGKMTMAMKMLYDQKNVFYLFNFVHPQEQPFVLEIQENKSDHTYFLDYAPSPFVVNPNHGKVFFEILNTPQEDNMEEMPKKKFMSRLFPGGR